MKRYLYESNQYFKTCYLAHLSVFIAGVQVSFTLDVSPDSRKSKRSQPQGKID